MGQCWVLNCEYPAIFAYVSSDAVKNPIDIIKSNATVAVAEVKSTLGWLFGHSLVSFCLQHSSPIVQTHGRRYKHPPRHWGHFWHQSDTNSSLWVPESVSFRLHSVCFTGFGSELVEKSTYFITKNKINKFGRDPNNQDQAKFYAISGNEARQSPSKIRNEHVNICSDMPESTGNPCIACPVAIGGRATQEFSCFFAQQKGKLVRFEALRLGLCEGNLTLIEGDGKRGRSFLIGQIF